jgi:ribonuclease D
MSTWRASWAAVLWLTACNPPPTNQFRVTATAAASAAASAAAEQAECRAGRDAQIAAYRAAVIAGDAWRAARSLDACARVLDDHELRRLIEAAEVPSLWADARNPKNSDVMRASALDVLIRDHPKEAPAASALKTKLEAAEKRRHDPAIGMTIDDVLASKWGRPRDVNRTVTSGGSHYQFVYGNGRYVYFENGRVVSIQD